MLVESYQLGLNYLNYMDAGEPSSYEEAIARPNADTWRQAMKSNMDSMGVGRTMKRLPCKWVFRYKYVSD